MPVRNLGLRTKSFQVAGEHFEVDRKYRLLELINVGAYVSACAAEDKEAREWVQVQKVCHILDDLSQARRTLRELRLLRHLQHENVTEIRNVFFTGDRGDLSTIYVVSEFMDTNLSFVLRSSESLTTDHHLFFLYQILRGMKYVHSANVIHGDLKPRNLLLNSNCDLKISGFGLTHVTVREKDSLLHETQWYCAPEVLTSSSGYLFASDVWSIGCIQAEMHLRRPLFHGFTRKQHVDLLSDLLGPPAHVEPADISAEACHKYIADVLKLQDRVWPPEIVPCTLPLERDIVSSMLRFDPDRRVTLSEALKHPFLESMHVPEDEPERRPLDLAEFAFEQCPTTQETFREEFFQEALWYRPLLKKKFEMETVERDWLKLAGQLRLLCSCAPKVSSRGWNPEQEFKEGESQTLAMATMESLAMVMCQQAQNAQ